MLTRIRIENFKAWKDTGEVRLAPLTVLFGANNAGKSSVGHLLLALKQTAASADRKRALHTGDDSSLIDLGTFVDTLFAHDKKTALEFSFEWSTPDRVEVRNPLAFVKRLLRNNANEQRCDQVKRKEHVGRGFESFPNDARLANFDPPDRKFVAVAVAHEQHPPIAQATDSKWLGWESALRDHGVNVEFLCRCDIQRFDDKKKGRKGRLP